MYWTDASFLNKSIRRTHSLRGGKGGELEGGGGGQKKDDMARGEMARCCSLIGRRCLCVHVCGCV